MCASSAASARTPCNNAYWMWTPPPPPHHIARKKGHARISSWWQHTLLGQTMDGQAPYHVMPCPCLPHRYHCPANRMPQSHSSGSTLPDLDRLDVSQLEAAVSGFLVEGIITLNTHTYRPGECWYSTYAILQEHLQHQSQSSNSCASPHT